MFRRILMASDLTQASSSVLDVALELGGRLGCEVVALHVTQPPFEPKSVFVPFADSEADFFRQIHRREEEAAERVLAEQVKEALARSPGGERPSIRTIVRSGHPAEVIPAAAAEAGADLIVMGTHGRTGWKHTMLGSIAERVVRSAACPVLTVRGTSS